MPYYVSRYAYGIRNDLPAVVAFLQFSAARTATGGVYLSYLVGVSTGFALLSSLAGTRRHCYVQKSLAIP